MSAIKTQFIDQKILYGTRYQRFLREFITHSGTFWLLDAVINIGAKGLFTHLSYLPQWALLLSSLVQAWVISRDEYRIRWWYVFIAPTLYTVVDILIEGVPAFFDEPYHIFYWFWAICMGFAYGFNLRLPSLSIFARAVLLVSLLPALYFFAELENSLVITDWATLSTYWFSDSAHFFILFGTLMLGLAIGIINMMRDRFEKLLYRLATHFEEIASWSFDKDLIQKSYDDAVVMDLQRVQRTLLFMDIRGFTPWSETHTPQEVVDMVNRFYHTAEAIIRAHHGFKIQMTGDEIMTRFYDPMDAIAAAVELQYGIARILAPFDLSAGIGLHEGDVVEGLVGGTQTRQYGIFGDVVNTAARLQGQAQAHQIVISARTWHHYLKANAEIPPPATPATVTLKGKSDPMPVFIINPPDELP